MSRRERFDNWFKLMIEDLNLRNDSWYEASHLKPWHWKKLWAIFDKYIDTNHSRAKEKLMAYDDAFGEGMSVILEAYGKTDSDLEMEEMMEHYINSPNYD
jgi:hypothetical protein